MKRQMQKGFTLIELMIVVAIIAILAAIAIPAYNGYIAESRTTSLEGTYATAVKNLEAAKAAHLAGLSTALATAHDKLTENTTIVQSSACGASATNYIAIVETTENDTYTVQNCATLAAAVTIDIDN